VYSGVLRIYLKYLSVNSICWHGINWNAHSEKATLSDQYNMSILQDIVELANKLLVPVKALHF
jgi:hypothetical protein